nr:MAG TPA: hypothetical protein [Caudoviricetes sp.]
MKSMALSERTAEFQRFDTIGIPLEYHSPRIVCWRMLENGGC